MTPKGALFFIEDIMFDQQKLIGQNRRMLRLDTRTGQPIENEVAAPPTQQSLAREQRLATKFGANWEKRIRPCGIIVLALFGPVGGQLFTKTLSGIRSTKMMITVN